MHRHLILPALVAVIVLSACVAPRGATPPPSGAPSPSTSPPPTASPVAYPTGADELVLRLEYVGGLMGPRPELDLMPAVSVYGDGRIISPGAQIAIYPSPILRVFQVAKLTPAGLAQLLSMAEAAGLTGPDADYNGQIPVADLPTIRFTTYANDKIHVITLNGLAGVPAGATPDPEADIRAKLIAFADALNDFSATFAGEVSETDLYDIDGLRIIVTPGAPDVGELEQAPVDWPLATPLASFGEPVSGGTYGSWGQAGVGARCGVVRGEDLATLLATLQKANVLTPFVSDGMSYGLYVRPLLPDEDGCELPAPRG